MEKLIIFLVNFYLMVHLTKQDSKTENNWHFKWTNWISLQVDYQIFSQTTPSHKYFIEKCFKQTTNVIDHDPNHLHQN